MTVEIISRPPPRRVICSQCDCELGYTKMDVRTHHPRIPDLDSYDYIDCPNCEAWVIVDKNLPPNFR